AADVAGLQRTQDRADVTGAGTDAVDDAIDDADIGHAPEQDARAADKWLDDCRVVNLIDEVLVVHQGVKPLDGQRVRQFRLRYVHDVRDQDSEQTGSNRN